MNDDVKRADGMGGRDFSSVPRNILPSGLITYNQGRVKALAAASVIPRPTAFALSRTLALHEVWENHDEFS